MNIISQQDELAVSATGFEYSAVTEGEKLQAAARRIKDCRHRIFEDVIEIGRELIAVKKMLAHGQFQKWIEAEFGWGKTTVRNFINVARNLGDKKRNCCSFGTGRPLQTCRSIVSRRGAAGGCRTA